MEFGKPQLGERLRLGLRNLYIVPTRFGWFWLAGLLLLQVVGIQLQSHGPLLLSFLMLGLLLLALHLTHFNLQGLELAAADPQPGHAHTGLAYPLRLHCPGRCEGWRQVDPSRWIASGGPGLDPDQARSGAIEWLQQQWWGLDIGWTRLWLGYDRQSQQALLQRLLGDQLQWLGALVLLALGLCLAAGLAALSWLQRRSEGDAPRRALDATLRQLARAGMGPEPGETLPAFAGRVERRWPQLAPELERFVALYQQLRYGAPPGPGQASGQLRRGRRQLQRRLQRLPR